MLKRPIPSSGELLPVVGLGTWIQFNVSSNSEKEELNVVLNHMLNAGASLIDSSPMYGNAEAVVGELTDNTIRADEFFYASKIWTTGEKEGLRSVERTMLLMKRSKMDLIQVHNLVDYKTHLKTLRKLKEEDKLRYDGITHYTVESHAQLEKIIKMEQPDFVQFNYSADVRNAENSLLKTAQDNGVAVIINEPFNKGQLLKKIGRKKIPEFLLEQNFKSWGEILLKYILAHPAVNCVIPGTSNPIHILENLAGGNGNLPDAKTKVEIIKYLELK